MRDVSTNLSEKQLIVIGARVQKDDPFELPLEEPPLVIRNWYDIQFTFIVPVPGVVKITKFMARLNDEDIYGNPECMKAKLRSYFERPMEIGFALGIEAALDNAEIFGPCRYIETPAATWQIHDPDNVLGWLQDLQFTDFTIIPPKMLTND